MKPLTPIPTVEDELAEALRRLDAHLDFASPVEVEEPICFVNADGINSAFAFARRVLADYDESRDPTRLK